LRGKEADEEARQNISRQSARKTRRH
jgi:hypothetical protein